MLLSDATVVVIEYKHSYMWHDGKDDMLMCVWGGGGGGGGYIVVITIKHKPIPLV